MIRLDIMTDIAQATLRWVNVRTIIGKLPREALLTRLRHCGQHPHMEEDHVLAYVSADGSTCWPVTLPATLPPPA
jgi:hypothetical protein